MSLWYSVAQSDNSRERLFAEQTKKPDAHIKIELTAEEYMKRAGEEHNRIMEEWEKNRK